MEEETREPVSELCGVTGLHQPLLELEMEGATNQGVQAPPEAGKAGKGALPQNL